MTRTYRFNVEVAHTEDETLVLVASDDPTPSLDVVRQARPELAGLKLLRYLPGSGCSDAPFSDLWVLTAA